MSSSISKSIFAAAAFLASPKAAQIGNWDIIYQSLETDFQDSVMNEITVDYRIGTGRTFKVDLFDKGCTDPITGMTITPTTARTAGATADHDHLEIMLDLDKSAITSSNLWSSSGNELELCIRVQLLSGVDVIKEDKRDIDIVFDFVIDFEADESVAMQTASMTSGSGQANVDSYVSACKCDDLDSFTCNSTPLTPNGILNVCIMSMDSDIEIAFLNKLELFQGNTLGNETLLVVDGLFVQNTEISSITVKNKTAVGVATVVPSRFFSYNGVSAATVTGEVQVKLVGPTRRLASSVFYGIHASKVVASTRKHGNDEFVFNYDASPASKAVVSARAMRGEEGIVRPGYNGNDVSPFQIAAKLEREMIEIPHVFSELHNNSGATKASFGATCFLSAAIAYFW